ncbi:MAG: 50S ribosomal protein L6 [Alphaproteobacteria bacterium]|nr:MAG: 50S ribosomal protein L6 [Alphaproteobacteria bacterium]
MSRIGKKPIPIPGGVTVTIGDGRVTAKGPKGELSMTPVKEVEVTREGDEILVRPVEDTLKARAMWGMQRTLVANLVDGVTKGFEKKLQIIGVGYRAQLQGRTLKLQLGFSHDVEYPVPEGIKIETPDQTTIVVSGSDKQKVGQVAAEIRAWRPPEPYKGKGVRYADEYVFRKEGKKK